jgi:hypothetical protein
MERFTKAAFSDADGATRDALCRDLERLLAARLEAAPDREAALEQVIAELRALGHDLWSFDQNDVFEVWCPDWHVPSGPGIVVTFAGLAVSVEWSQH